MATKYFCDVCEKEIEIDEAINLYGRAKLKTFCKVCWEKVEVELQKLKSRK